MHARLRIRGCHPLRPAFPDRSASFTHTTGLFRFRSPLLTESRLMSVPPGTEMFQFPGFASPHYVFMRRYPKGVGCPIRISTDQRLLAAPRGFSQRATSFIASWCQGIHRMPFFHSKSRRHAQEQTLPPACWPHLDRTDDRPYLITRYNRSNVPERSRHATKVRFATWHAQRRTRTRFTLTKNNIAPQTGAPSAPHNTCRANPNFPCNRPWRRTDSNRRPPACKAGALPAELRPQQPTSGGPGRI